MSNTLHPLRPGLTAIAAIIALSSTPIVAQVTDSNAGQAAPAVMAPPAPAVSAAAAAPETPPAAPVEAAPAAPAPAMRTMSTPVVHEADDMAAEAPTPAAPAYHTAAAPSAHKAASRKPAAPVERSAAPAPSAPSAFERQAAPASAPAIPAASAAPAEARAPAVTKTTATETSQSSLINDETAPIAGAIGLGLIVIGGIAIALRRRRDEGSELAVGPAESAPAARVEPLDPIAAAAVPMPAAAGPATLPGSFDLSRFGHHTQAAYRGPTPDNPFLSLKRRLKRASFLDSRERDAARAGLAPAPAQREAAAPTVRAEQDNGQVTVRLSPRRDSGRFGYVFQK